MSCKRVQKSEIFIAFSGKTVTGSDLNLVRMIIMYHFFRRFILSLSRETCGNAGDPYFLNHQINKHLKTQIMYRKGCKESTQIWLK